MGRPAITLMAANLLHCWSKASSGIPVMISNIDPYRIRFFASTLGVVGRVGVARADGVESGFAISIVIRLVPELVCPVHSSCWFNS